MTVSSVSRGFLISNLHGSLCFVHGPNRSPIKGTIIPMHCLALAKEAVKSQNTRNRRIHTTAASSRSRTATSQQHPRRFTKKRGPKSTARCCRPCYLCIYPTCRLDQPSAPTLTTLPCKATSHALHHRHASSYITPQTPLPRPDLPPSRHLTALLLFLPPASLLPSSLTLYRAHVLAIPPPTAHAHFSGPLGP